MGRGTEKFNHKGYKGRTKGTKKMGAYLCPLPLRRSGNGSGRLRDLLQR